MSQLRRLVASLALLLLVACPDGVDPLDAGDAGQAWLDAQAVEVGVDAASTDTAWPTDLGSADLGSADLGSPDTGSLDAGASCARRILQGEVTNARELGGHSLGSAGRVGCGAVMRGGHLGGLGADGCAELSALGIRSVVDLRLESSQQTSPPAACVEAQAALVSAPMPQPSGAPSSGYYVNLLDETAAIAAAFTTLGAVESYPVYIHCVIGRDRASVISALVLLALGASRDTVVAEFELSSEAGVTVDAAWIEAALDEVERRGGIDSYLGSVGVTTDQLAVLRTQAIAP